MKEYGESLKAFERTSKGHQELHYFVDNVGLESRSFYAGWGMQTSKQKTATHLPSGRRKILQNLFCLGRPCVSGALQSSHMRPTIETTLNCHSNVMPCVTYLRLCTCEHLYTNISTRFQFLFEHPVTRHRHTYRKEHAHKKRKRNCACFCLYFLFHFRTSSSSIQAHMSAVKSLGESDGKRNFEDFLSNLVSRDRGGSPKGACAPGL